MYFYNGTVVKDIKGFDSFSFIIPNSKYRNTTLRIITENVNEEQLYLFDAKKCPYKFLIFQLEDVTFGFDPFYQMLIAKDLSKGIEISAYPFFEIFIAESAFLRKKHGATKFVDMCITSWNGSKPNSKIKEFILNYMEEDDMIYCEYRLFPQVEEHKRDKYTICIFTYTVSQAIEAFKIMEIREQSGKDLEEYPDDRPLFPFGLC